MRIKVPPKTEEADHGHEPQSSTSEKPPPRRLPMKRRTAVESDEDGAQDSETHDTKDWNSHATEKYSDFGPPYDGHGSHTHGSHLASSSRSKGKARPGADVPPSTKRRRIISSDEDYGHDDVGRSSGDESEEDLVVPETKRQYGAPAKSSKDKTGKSKAIPKKPRHDDAENALTALNKRPRAVQSLVPEDTIIDIFANAAKPAASPSSKDPTPPPTKKRKLPQIKRNKPANTAVSTTPSTKTPAVADPAVLPVTEGHKAAGRAIAATIGVADFDLRDASVYAELFKPAAGGSSTPRSGLSRREKEEERRRELMKMRDEARAKRLVEAIPAFDLALQTDKITRYEEKLKAIRSNALYPNCLAAKWRERWEREKEQEKRQQRKEWHASTPWDESNGREEGEMNDTPGHL